MYAWSQFFEELFRICTFKPNFEPLHILIDDEIS